MASSLNKVELIGRLGKDPEVKNLSNGSSVANFSVATSESWKDKRTGEKVEKTEWHNIVVWNENTIKFVESYLKKGDLVRIEGKIQTRKWEDQDGKDRYATEIVIPAFASIDALMKLSFDNDNDRGGSRDDDRGSSRGGSSRGGNSRGRDDRDDRGGDDRGSSRGRGRDDDRGGDDRGSSRGASRGRDDDRGARDDRGGNDRGGSSRGGGRNADMDDDIPF